MKRRSSSLSGLVPLGYRGLAVDVFGTAVSAGGLERCDQEMNRFMADRSSLRRRLSHVVEVGTALEGTEPERVAALGFCALDLARINAPVRGVASFHGVLTAPEQAADSPADDPIPSRSTDMTTVVARP